MNISVKETMQRFDMIKAERANFEDMWEEIASFILPTRGGFNTTFTPGTRLNNSSKTLDGIGEWASETLASALYGFVTNPASAWFSLATLDPKILYEHRDALEWVQYATNYLYALFAAPSKRFYDSSHELFLDQVPFGTGILMLEDRPGYG